MNIVTMKNYKTIILTITLCLTLSVGSFTCGYLCNNIHEEDISTYIYHKVDTVALKATNFYSKSPQEGLQDALIYFDVKHANIVYAQAVLETGHFKSYNCLQRNNLFGLYNSKTKSYYTFNHWTESVIAYKLWIQNRYKEDEDYLSFLNRIGYAEEPLYNKYLTDIIKACGF